MTEHGYMSLSTRKGTRWSKFSNFSFMHKTEEKRHRIYLLVFLLPKSEENYLINDVIKCCHYNDKLYYVI